MRVIDKVSSISKPGIAVGVGIGVNIGIRVKVGVGTVVATEVGSVMGLVFASIAGFGIKVGISVGTGVNVAVGLNTILVVGPTVGCLGTGVMAALHPKHKTVKNSKSNHSSLLILSSQIYYIILGTV